MIKKLVLISLIPSVLFVVGFLLYRYDTSKETTKSVEAHLSYFLPKKRNFVNTKNEQVAAPVYLEPWYVNTDYVLMLNQGHDETYLSKNTNISSFVSGYSAKSLKELSLELRAHTKKHKVDSIVLILEDSNPFSSTTIAVGEINSLYGTLVASSTAEKSLSKKGYSETNSLVFAKDERVRKVFPILAQLFPKSNLQILKVPKGIDSLNAEKLAGDLSEDFFPGTLFLTILDEKPEDALQRYGNPLSNLSVSNSNLLEHDSQKTLFSKYNITTGFADLVREIGRSFGSGHLLESSDHVHAMTDTNPSIDAGMVFFGDVMLDRDTEYYINRRGNSDWIFNEVLGHNGYNAKDLDVVSINLEGPLTDNAPNTSKSINFRFDPELADTLVKYKISHASQANNHSLDMGNAGYEESMAVLASSSIKAYGKQYGIDEVESYYIDEINGKKVAFVGLNDTNSPINITEMNKLVSGVSRIADFTIINIHWGQEYRRLSNDRQKRLAEALVSSGADLIIGHHPHVVQEMELINGKPVFYSLGNFVFDQYFSKYTQEGLAVGVKLSANKVLLEILPFNIDKTQPKWMNKEEKSAFLKDFIDRSTLGSYTFADNTIEIPL